MFVLLPSNCFAIHNVNEGLKSNTVEDFLGVNSGNVKIITGNVRIIAQIFESKDINLNKDEIAVGFLITGIQKGDIATLIIQKNKKFKFQESKMGTIAACILKTGEKAAVTVERGGKQIAAKRFEAIPSPVGKPKLKQTDLSKSKKIKA